jgi:hypothetical protein
VRDALHQFVYARYGVGCVIRHDGFPLLVAALPQSLARLEFHGMPTEPIIGSVSHEWNRFSIFICNEIFVASREAMS